MKRENVETIIWVFCILVLSLLSFKVIGESNNYNCGECVVTLSNTIGGTDKSFENTPFVISELFESFVDGKCEVTWNPTHGFMKNG